MPFIWNQALDLNYFHIKNTCLVYWLYTFKLLAKIILTNVYCELHLLWKRKLYRLNKKPTHFDGWKVTFWMSCCLDAPEESSCDGTSDSVPSLWTRHPKSKLHLSVFFCWNALAWPSALWKGPQRWTQKLFSTQLSCITAHQPRFQQQEEASFSKPALMRWMTMWVVSCCSFAQAKLLYII